MEIIEWVEEIEKIYKDLVKKTKKENLSEIQLFKEEQAKILESALKGKRTLTKDALSRLSMEIQNNVKNFEKKVSEAISNIENEYHIRKTELLKSIIKKLELDF